MNYDIIFVSTAKSIISIICQKVVPGLSEHGDVRKRNYANTGGTKNILHKYPKSLRPPLHTVRFLHPAVS